MTLLLSLALSLACSTPAPAPKPAPVPTAAPVQGHDEDGHHDGEAGEAHHEHGPHGGIVQSVGDLHVEALMMPSGVMFFLSDAEQKALTVDGYGGSAVVTGPGGVVTAQLMAMGDHLHAPATLVQGEPATAVLTLTHAGSTASASFETPAVGLQSHDHRSLHGGQVSMWGNMHLEYAPKDGEYRVWVTDEHRNPVTDPVTGSVRDGATTVALTAGPDGSLVGRGEGAGTRAVSIDVTVGGKSFTLSFSAVGGGGMPSMPGM